MARKWHKSKKSLHKAIHKQLNYVKHNIKTIHTLVGDEVGVPLLLSLRDLRLLWIIQELYRQQQRMYKCMMNGVTGFRIAS